MTRARKLGARVRGGVADQPAFVGGAVKLAVGFETTRLVEVK